MTSNARRPARHLQHFTLLMPSTSNLISSPGGGYYMLCSYHDSSVTLARPHKTHSHTFTHIFYNYCYLRISSYLPPASLLLLAAASSKDGPGRPPTTPRGANILVLERKPPLVTSPLLFSSPALLLPLATAPSKNGPGRSPTTPRGAKYLFMSASHPSSRLLYSSPRPG